ncbi:MAG: hypothetical protein HN675_08900 [Opitutae bacterium]|nr:hypothetical protein [Opitutae bacterium]MBT7853427.1 hypothetical protein [Opitutae bacterium]
MDSSRHDTAPGAHVPPIDPEYFNHVVSHLPPNKGSMDLGDWFLRVIHLPENKTETVWDIYFEKGAGQIQLISFQASARQLLADSGAMVSTERGAASLPENEPLLLEIQNGLCQECQNFEDEKPGGDVYILHFQHGENRHQVFARNPRLSKLENAEPWQRLLNRLVGSALLVQRSIHLG